MSKSFEMTRGTVLIHAVVLRDGSVQGDDVYNKNKKGLQFRNVHHMKAFASKYNYSLTATLNT